MRSEIPLKPERDNLRKRRDPGRLPGARNHYGIHLYQHAPLGSPPLAPPQSRVVRLEPVQHQPHHVAPAGRPHGPHPRRRLHRLLDALLRLRYHGNHRAGADVKRPRGEPGPGCLLVRVHVQRAQPVRVRLPQPAVQERVPLPVVFSVSVLEPAESGPRLQRFR